MSDRVIIKLGGSVITDKTAACRVNHAALKRIAAAVAAAPSSEMIVVHGAGSCGHPEAKKYHLDEGIKARETEGIWLTHEAVSSLNTEVVKALRSAGVRAVGIHPLHSGIADNRRLIAFESRHLDKMLELGMVPVIHGDVVMDLSRGACIVSGDQLVHYLAVALKCNRIGLATDVPGVLDGGCVVPEITPKTVRTLQIGNSKHTDVTGGMKGKIDELLGLAATGASADIFEISRLGDFLSGKDHGGTKVRGG